MVSDENVAGYTACLMAVLSLQDKDAELINFFSGADSSGITPQDLTIAAEAYRFMEEDEMAACMIELEAFKDAINKGVERRNELSFLPDELVKEELTKAPNTKRADENLNSLIALGIEVLGRAGVIGGG